tara:strand:- start:104 stop:784 length:681 start_codon:yes stop_codon:yes gene_type:complete
MSLSIIIPCLNEEKTITKVIKEIIFVIQKKFEYEIIVVDDFSKDRTINLVKEIIEKEKSIKLVQNAKNFGYGGSFKEGLKFAEKKYSTIIPGDGETNIEEILMNYSKLESVNKIFFYNIDNDRGFLRNFISSSYTKIINFFFNLKLKYYNGSFFYKTEDLVKITINSNGFFFLTEIIIKMLKLNSEYIELPLSLKNKAKLSRSNAIKFSNLLSIIKDFLKVYFLKK